MAPLAARLLLLAALAVCLLAAPAHAGRDLGVKTAGPRILAAETYSHDQELPDYLDHIPRRKALATTCGRTTVVIKSQYLGPYDLHNYIFNMTFYNGCAFNVTSPLRVFQCQDFGNVWQGILKNPAKNPTKYQTGEIFGPVPDLPGYCDLMMNRGPLGNIQMYRGETVHVLYAWTMPTRPCPHELHFSNGNQWIMTSPNIECVIAPQS